jgi:MoxR-like ATPase
VLSLAELDQLRTATTRVYVDAVLRQWLVRLVRATRELDGVDVGASVRGSLALERVARAWALLDGRDYATPADVEHLFLPVVVHRIGFTPGFLAETREHRWAHAMEALRDRCLEQAPRPGDDLDERVAAAALGR